LGNLVQVTGPNASGKSSVLDAIMAALGCGKLLPDEPIRRGEKSARIRLDLVPLPREDAGLSAGPEFSPYAGVEDIIGVGETWRGALNRQQIYTINDLLVAGSRLKSSAELAAPAISAKDTRRATCGDARMERRIMCNRFSRRK
jgi:ABC-type branched-subunit amino acid transport system ATPase component